MKQYLNLLQKYLREQLQWVFLLILLMGGVLGLQLLTPQIIGRFLDAVQQERPVAELWQLAALFIGLALFSQFLNLATAYVSENVAWQATNALRVDLAQHCLQLDMAFHKTHKPGELIERVDGDVNKLADLFSRLFIKLFANALLLMGVLLMLTTISWPIGLVIALTAGVGMWVIQRLNKIAIPRAEAQRAVEATLYGYLEEWLSGTETIRSSAGEAYIMGRLYHLLRERWLVGLSFMRVNAALRMTPIFMFSLAYITAFILGQQQYQNTILSIGEIYLIFYYIDLLREPLWNTLDQIEKLQGATASINRIMVLFSAQPTLPDGRGAEPQLTPAGVEVAFHQVAFAYADEPDQPILQNVNFTLAPGRVLGLLGRTGSGKTTLTKLLLRFYDPTAGVITLGGKDLRHYTHHQLRHLIGIVTQQVHLFHASVRDNLTLFDPAVPDEKIITALQEIGLGEWLRGLPQGLDTHLAGDSGLSAGEAQLLAFTRVFLANPRLVLLDEASSRLDPATEQIMEQALHKLLANRTVIIVAHRLATVQRADEIMVLGHGRVLEHGGRVELAQNPQSHFYALLQTGMSEVMG